MPSGRTNNFPESGRDLGHVTPTIFGSTVGYPSNSLASCFMSTLVCERALQSWILILCVIAVLLTPYSFYPRDAMLARVIAIVTCPSVYPSVCHTPVLCQNEES